MATATISPKFQIVIPKEVREKLHLAPSQRLQVVEKGDGVTIRRTAQCDSGGSPDRIHCIPGCGYESPVWFGDG